MKRYAIVRNADSRRQLEAYLPANYSVVAEVVERVSQFAATHHDATDKLSHPVMKCVEASA